MNVASVTSSTLRSVPASMTRAGGAGHARAVVTGTQRRLARAHLGRWARTAEGLALIVVLGVAQGAVQTYRSWRGSVD